ncbi:MAG TPA: TonB-dependent receptor [Bacteroidales bacterium]
MKLLISSRKHASLQKLNTLLLSVVFLLFSSLTLKALNPGKIEGSVSDAESFATVPSAKVELLNAADSSIVKTVLTNNEGRYVIDDVPFGKYVVRISGMTYKKYIIPDIVITPEKPSVKFGTTNLMPESKVLKEVGVYGYKLTGQMEDDKTIYTIKEKSSDIAQSGLDLLRQLPDVNVDFRTNEVTLAGNSNILFQVNGKRVDRTYLMQLNPKLIDKIEIVTNPGVKYDADVDAVINIILKKNMNFGLSGRVSLEIPTSKGYFTNNNASFDYFTKGFRFFVSGWGGGEKWDIDISSNRNNYLSNETTTFSQHVTGTSGYKYGGFNYGFDWFINDNNTFNFYSSVSPRIPNHDDYTSDDFFTNHAGTLHTQAVTYTTDRRFFNDYSVYFKHKFPKKDHEISFESYYSNNQSDNENNYYEQQYVSTDSLSPDHINERFQITDNNKWQINIKSDYTYPFTDKLKLSAGANTNLNRIKNSYNINDDEFTDKIHYNEDRYSAYTNLAWNVANLNLQSGVRYESSFVNIDHQTISNGNYYCFLPFASVQYKLGKKQTLRLNYRRSINRPGMSQVSPFGVREDAYTLSLGNPSLSPAYVNKIEFTHRIQLKGPMFVSYRPYISFITDGIRQINLPSTDSITRKQYINVSNELEYGTVLSGSVAFAKWWSVSPSFTIFQREIKALTEYGILSQKRSAWRFNCSSQFILPKDWVIFIDYNYRSPVQTHQSRDERQYQFVTGFYKSINKKFNITVFTLNPWNHRYFFNKNTTKTETMEQTSTGVVKYNWILNIRLGYSFNKGKEVKKVDRQVETDSDNGGKKGVM